MFYLWYSEDKKKYMLGKRNAFKEEALKFGSYCFMYLTEMTNMLAIEF